MQYDIMPGRGRENAKKAIELAEERGFDATEVRTFRDGYYVPLSEDDAPEENTEEEGDSGKDESKAEETKPATRTRKRATTKKE